MATSGSAANPNSVLAKDKDGAQKPGSEQGGTQAQQPASLDLGQYQSSAGRNVAAGQSILMALATARPDNQPLTDLAFGRVADTAAFQTNLGLLDLYNQSQLATSQALQSALEDKRFGQTSSLMAQEAVLTGGLAKQQAQGAVDLQKAVNTGTKDVAALQKGASDYAALQTRGASDFRATAELAGSKYGADKNVDIAREQSGAVKYGADKNVDVAREQAGAAKYGADKSLDVAREQSGAVKYGADKSVDVERERSSGALGVQREQNLATKYGIDSQERQIGLKGAEDRKTLQEGTRQQLALRSDARGAVARAGARFYG